MAEYHPEWEMNPPDHEEFKFDWIEVRCDTFRRCSISNKLLWPYQRVYFGEHRCYGSIEWIRKWVHKDYIDFELMK